MSRNANGQFLHQIPQHHTYTPGKKKSLIQKRKENQEAVE